MQILVVEDDRGISSFLEKGLHAEGYITAVAATAEDALGLLDDTERRMDLVLLDLGLPSGDGLDVLRQLRHDGHTMPVIVLTARLEGVRGKGRGLNAGANDYVTKPFSFEELLAQIRASAFGPRSSRRHRRSSYGDLRLDLLTKIAWRAGRRIDLAPREWALLEIFMRHPTRSFPAHRFWGVSGTLVRFRHQRRRRVCGLPAAEDQPTRPRSDALHDSRCGVPLRGMNQRATLVTA